MRYLLISGVLVCAAFGQDFKLPPPFATPSARNQSRVIDRPAGAQLKVPAGFTVEEYMTGFATPRKMILGPSNELLIADSAPSGKGTVWIAQGKDKRKLIEGLDRPFGMAFWKDYLYVGEPTSIKRYKYDAKAMMAAKGEEVVSLKGFGSGHNTRNILFDRKGEKMYINIGSQSNVSAGEDPMRAAVNRFNPDGSGHEIFVSGTRNPTGIHLYPGTDTIWITVEERDELGDDLVPEYFTHIEQGRFYGWPYAYIGRNEDPRREGERRDLVAKTVAPDFLLPAHASALEFAFYTGKVFPNSIKAGRLLRCMGRGTERSGRGTRLLLCRSRMGSRAVRCRNF